MEEVAPVRERGLKFNYRVITFEITGRSREGARIEIVYGLGAR